MLLICGRSQKLSKQIGAKDLSASDVSTKGDTVNPRAVLVGVDFGKQDFAASLEELSLLAYSAGAIPITTITCKRVSPDSALFVGSGKAQEIADAVVDEVFGNRSLVPRVPILRKKEWAGPASGDPGSA